MFTLLEEIFDTVIDTVCSIVSAVRTKIRQWLGYTINRVVEVEEAAVIIARKATEKVATEMLVVVGKVVAIEYLEDNYKRMMLSYQGCINLIQWLCWVWDIARQIESVLRWARWKKWRLTTCTRRYKRDAGMWGSTYWGYLCKSTNWKEWNVKHIPMRFRIK